MIYVIHPNVKQYLSYVLDSKEARRKLGRDTMFHFDQSPKTYADIWQPLEISFAKLSGGKQGKMPDLMIRNGRLFLGENAYNCLHEMLLEHGEFLPVTFGDGTGYLFNILALADDVDGLDKRLCQKNEYGELQSLGFRDEKVSQLPVFRTSFDDYMGAYCNDEFRKKVEDAGLVGLIFSEDPGNVFPPDPLAGVPKAH